MKLLKPLFVLFLCLSAGILQNLAYARSEAEVARDLAKASDTAVATYKEEGMIGLIIKTQECYKENTRSHFYCVYLDLASRRIEQIFVEAMNFPPNEFFSDEKFGSRIAPVFVSSNMDMNTANQYLALVTPVINNLVEEKLLGKTWKETRWKEIRLSVYGNEASPGLGGNPSTKAGQVQV